MELDEDYGRRSNYIKKLVNRVRSLEEQIHDIHEQHVKNTQVVFLFGYSLFYWMFLIIVFLIFHGKDALHGYWAQKTQPF